MRRHILLVRTEVYLIVDLVHQIQLDAVAVGQLAQHVGGAV